MLWSDEMNQPGVKPSGQKLSGQKQAVCLFNSCCPCIYVVQAIISHFFYNPHLVTEMFPVICKLLSHLAHCLNDE